MNDKRNPMRRPGALLCAMLLACSVYEGQANETPMPDVKVELGQGFRLRLVSLLGGSKTSYESEGYSSPSQSAHGFGGPFKTKITSPDQLCLIFRVESDQPEYRNRRSLAAADVKKLRERIAGLLQRESGGIINPKYRVMVCQPEGTFKTDYSMLDFSSGYSSTMGKSGPETYFEPHVTAGFSVPRSLRDLEVRLVPFGTDAHDVRTSATFLICNPGYNPYVPVLDDEGPLPQIKSVGRISVRLDQFATHAYFGTEGLLQADLLRGNGVIRSCTTRNRPDAQPGTVALFRLQENDRLTTAWVIEKVEIRDAEKHLGFGGVSHNHSLPELQPVVFDTDISWLTQPAELRVYLQRPGGSGLSPEEMASFEVPLPVSGEYSNVNVSHGYWDSEVTVRVAAVKCSKPLPEPWGGMPRSKLLFGVEERMLVPGDSNLTILGGSVTDGRTTTPVFFHMPGWANRDSKILHWMTEMQAGPPPFVSIPYSNPTTATLLLASARPTIVCFRARARIEGGTDKPASGVRSAASARKR